MDAGNVPKEINIPQHIPASCDLGIFVGVGATEDLGYFGGHSWCLRVWRCHRVHSILRTQHVGAAVHQRAPRHC